MNFLTRFYRISSPVPRRQLDPAQEQKLYKRLRLQAFIAATLGYSLYYVCRTSLNVMKKPILDSGTLDATQIGVISSALLFAYAVGKFVNGFIADYCNIKRFMATGLIVSAVANMLMGALGVAHSVIPTAVIFISFAVMWGLNGWAQSMGAPPAIISLSRWYPLKERGTYYGGEHRFDSRLAGRILRVCDCRRHRSRHRAADAPRHARIEGTAARGDAGARRAGNRAGVIRKRDSEAGIADACGVDSRGRERIHVHIPLCHQRVGRVVPAGGEKPYPSYR